MVTDSSLWLQCMETSLTLVNIILFHWHFFFFFFFLHLIYLSESIYKYTIIYIKKHGENEDNSKATSSSMLKTAFTEDTQDLGHIRTLTMIVLSSTSWHKRTVLCLVEWCDWKLDTVIWVLTLREWESQNAIAPANAINLKWPTTYWRTARPL